MRQVQQGFEAGWDLFKQQRRDPLGFLVHPIAPVRFHQTQACVQALRADRQHSIPLLNCLSQEITAHIETRQASSREHKLLLTGPRAELVKLLTNVCITPAEFVRLLIAVERGINIRGAFANQGAIAIDDHILRVVSQNPLKGLFCLFQLALRQVDLPKQALRFECLWKVGEDVLAIRHCLINAARTDSILSRA